MDEISQAFTTDLTHVSRCRTAICATLSVAGVTSANIEYLSSPQIKIAIAIQIRQLREVVLRWSATKAYRLPYIAQHCR
ncbi:hypothetical protein [Undibacterium sp. YM2]|uniref:hypothetical protein n=1 Tax=Undibacterium sp. YM2 TaxID=2058625 RepID=UPI00138A62B6|nr:hypothetical protein [Undibacterium sp. YM2]